MARRRERVAGGVAGAHDEVGLGGCGRAAARGPLEGRREGRLERLDKEPEEVGLGAVVEGGEAECVGEAAQRRLQRCEAGAKRDVRAGGGARAALRAPGRVEEGADGAGPLLARRVELLPAVLRVGQRAARRAHLLGRQALSEQLLQREHPQHHCLVLVAARLARGAEVKRAARRVHAEPVVRRDIARRRGRARVEPLQRARLQPDGDALHLAHVHRLLAVVPPELPAVAREHHVLGGVAVARPAALGHLPSR